MIDTTFERRIRDDQHANLEDVLTMARRGDFTTWAVSNAENWAAVKRLQEQDPAARLIDVVAWSGHGTCAHDGWDTPAASVMEALEAPVHWVEAYGVDAPYRWVAEQERIVGLPVHEPAIVVAAGAGTGKTETMVRRVRRILLSEPSVHPRDLALITFTRAAASSMRIRLGDMLASALRGMQAAGGSVSEARMARMRAIVEGLSECSIRTIDSWCLDLLTTQGGDETPRLGGASDLRERAIDYALAGVVQEMAVAAARKCPGGVADVYQLHRTAYAPWKWTIVRMKCKEAWEAAERSGVPERDWGSIRWCPRPEHPGRNGGEQRLDELLPHVVLRAQRHYRKMMVERHQTDLPDLIGEVLSRLDARDTRVASAYRLPTFMFMDELQDSSPAQLELLRCLRAHGVRTLAVGDWKQAIYGFRGATPDAMATVPNLIGVAHGTTYPLRTNFRSSPALLAAFHGIFTRMGTEGGNPSPAFPYDASRDRLIASRERAPETVLVRETAEDPRTLVGRALEAFKAARSVAFLVRTNADVDKIDEKLRGNLPSGASLRVIRTDDVDNRRFARSVMVLARMASLAGKRDNSAVEAQLPMLLHLADSPFQGQLWPKGAPKAQDICEAPSQWLHQLDIQPTVKWLLECCARTTEPYRRELLRWLGRAIDAVGPGMATPAAVAEWLDRADTGEDPATVVEAVRSAEHAIFVMTVHQAKGLEFDVVVLRGWDFGPFRGCRVVRADQTSKGPHAGEGGQTPVACWAWSRRKAGKPTWTNGEEPNRPMLRGEDLRLFYVALTRARRGVVYVPTGLGARYITEGATR